MIKPITLLQQKHVKSVTTEYIQRASKIYQQSFSMVLISFDLKGRAAGMYRVKNNVRLIRYNPYLFAKYFDDNVAETVPHEVAHYITEKLYGIGRVRPHGNEWGEVMRAFGIESKRVGHRYDMQGVPVRVHRRYAYRCRCATHNVTTRRHKQMKSGMAEFLCRRCGESIILVKSAATNSAILSATL